MIDELDHDQWRRAGELFHVLVGLDPGERSARLSTMSSDPALRRAVEALLAGDAAADDRLPQPGFGILQNWSPDDPLHLVGRTVSHFRVDEALACGGMGVVYRAEDLRLRRAVALKFLLPRYHVSDSSRERFLREARAAGGLDHPNVCAVHEIGESTAGVFLAMPLYAGETLKDRLARTGTIPTDESLAIASQIAAGLQHAHAAGILHRDVKPGNVMLLPDGTAKILDFGLAKVRADSTASAVVLGTVSYMSPEQIRGGALDARTDLWALGVVLYEMLSGVRPFVADSEAAMLYQIQELTPRALSEVSPSVIPAVEALVHRLLEKNPDDRYEAASAVLETIAAVRIGARGMERPAGRRARRRSMMTAASVVALVAIGYAGVGPGRSLLDNPAIDTRDPLVVADFDVSGSDSSLGPVLADAFGRSLGGSPVFAVMPRGRVESVLRRMRRAPGTRLTPAIAREVAEREGVRAFARGDVERLGSSLLVSIRLVAAHTGDELASFHGTAARPESDLLRVLDSLGKAVRRRADDSLRTVPAPPPLPALTTSSLEALRLFDATFPKPRTVHLSLRETLANLRQAVALDSGFVYAWLMMGNVLSAHRTPARDSAYIRMYRLGDQLTPFERAQAAAWYWVWIAEDRPRAFIAYENLLATGDSVRWQAVLNLVDFLNGAREFSRSDSVLRRYEETMTQHGRAADAFRALLVDAQIGEGRRSVAESLLVSEARAQSDTGLALRTRVRLALATLELDSAEDFAQRVVRLSRRGGPADTLAQIARTRGRLSDANRFATLADSLDADDLKAVQFAPVFERPLSLAAEELWLLGEPSRAIERLDRAFAAHPVRSLKETQNRMDAIRGAALYAAAGRPERASSIVSVLMQTSDSIGKRAVYSLRQRALGEIALSENRPRDAMTFFHESDFAADDLPATRCAVCTFPLLARAAERAGWADSARFYWERYVNTVALDRVSTDQWFLGMAYRRLAASYASEGDSSKAAEYRTKLEKLWRNADPGVRRRMSDRH